MDGLLNLLGSFPTVVFAVLSAISVLYWALVLVGAADLDALDGLTGKAEGVAHSAVDAAADAISSADVASAARVGRVPLTITATLFSLLGFLGSGIAEHFLVGFPSLISTPVAIAAALLFGVGGAYGASRALRGVFSESSEAGGESLIGKTCKITIEADDKGGQARAGEVIVQVRVVGGRLARDEEAVIVERSDDGVFVVEPMRALLPNEQDAFARLQSTAPAESSVAVTVDASTKK